MADGHQYIKQLEQLQDKERKISELHNQMSAERDQTIAERISLNAAGENMQYQMEAEKNRAKQSEISLLQLKLEHGFQSLDKSFNEAEACANKLFQIIQTCREKNQPIPSNIESSYAQWKAIVDKTRDIKLQTKLLFDEQIEKIEQGCELSTLPDLPIPRTLPRPENAFNPFNVFPNPMMAGGMGPPRPGMVPIRHMPHGMVRPQMVPSMSVQSNIMQPPSTVQSTQAPSSEALPAVKMPPVTSTSSDILPPQMTSMEAPAPASVPAGPLRRKRTMVEMEVENKELLKNIKKRLESQLDMLDGRRNEILMDLANIDKLIDAKKRQNVTTEALSESFNFTG